MHNASDHQLTFCELKILDGNWDVGDIHFIRFVEQKDILQLFARYALQHKKTFTKN